MDHRGKQREEAAPAADPPRDVAREDREVVQDRQDRQFEMLMVSIQTLSNTMQSIVERQQPQQPQHHVPTPEAEVPPSLPPAVLVEPAELTGITPIAAQYKAFMSTRPPRFTGKEGPDRAEEWLEEIERAFEMMDIPPRLWIRFGTFQLVEDAKAWWKSLLEIRYEGQQPTWEEFSIQFRETYVPQVARERRMREFLELAQAGRPVADYAARFRHLQRYCPHLFGSEKERAGKFVWGLDEGLRPRVMSNNPHTLLQAVEMATRMEEDYLRSQALLRRQRGIAPTRYQFKRPTSTFRRSHLPPAHPARPVGSQRSVSGQCPRCYRYHPTEECPRGAVVCYNCHQTGHYSRDCPRKRSEVQTATGSSAVVPTRVPIEIAPSRAISANVRREPALPAPPASQRGRPAGRVYSTTIQDLQSQDLIQGTLLLYKFFVKVLFDTGATHSFVARRLVEQLGREVLIAPFVLRITSPLGVKQIDVEYIVVDELYLEDRSFPATLILLDMVEFDIILGMDWLVRHGVMVDCQKRRLIVGPGSELQRVFKTQTSELDTAHFGYLRGSETVRRADPIFIVTWTAEGTLKPGVEHIPVVQEYVDVFPEELPGLPPEREVQFTIELTPGTQPISKAPYRMAPAELAELKKQI
ncbi:unnamed protein product [Victoria cruziana]